MVDLDLGYELRCAPPIPYDCDYVRDLGWGAVRYVLGDGYAGGAMVCLDGGRIRPLPFAEMMEEGNGRTRVRMVDIGSESYQVARQYMIRVEASDLRDEATLARLAAEARMTPAAFCERFAAVA